MHSGRKNRKREQLSVPVFYGLEDWMKRSYDYLQDYNNKEFLTKIAKVITKPLNLRKIALFSQIFKKILQNLSAFFLQNAAHQGGGMGEILHKQIHHTAAGAHLPIPGAEIDPGDAGV